VNISNSGEGDSNWPDSVTDHIIESPVRDLFNTPIDYSQNLLGKLWIERGNYALIHGSSEVGKSVLAAQIAIEAALGRETFGIAVNQRLIVLIIQAEDSKNDRVLQFHTMLKRLTPEDQAIVHENVRIVTPRKRALRGSKLFAFLSEAFKDTVIDLVIMNPALAFLDGQPNDSVAVGDFLREQFQEFLRQKNAGGIVIHHTPKPPKSGKTRSTEQSQYAGHGSAEWANAPRASMTIERTLVGYVFEFTIGKRGKRSGWLPNQEGYFVRYFTHSRVGGELIWLPATEQDIAAAMSGISPDDFSHIFRGDEDLTFDVIKAKFRSHGYSYTDEEIARVLDIAVDTSRLNRVEENGETIYRTVKSAKKAAQDIDRMDKVLKAVQGAGEKGIILSKLRVLKICGNVKLDEYLDELERLGRIYCVERNRTKRYFATKSSGSTESPDGVHSLA
jgi:AAA domain-containing protein